MIELLVVVALIAVISLLVIPGISSYFRLSMNSAIRQMATTIREAYHSTSVTGNIHRVVYDLAKNEFWVESGPPTVLLDTSETLEKEKNRSRWKTSSEEENTQKSEFQMDETITKDRIKLPDGVEFTDIMSGPLTEPITEGRAYTHFFPHGLSEQTVIHLTDTSEHKVSLIISPTLGKTRLVSSHITLEDAFGK